MTSLQKIVAGAIIGLLWLAAIVAKHFWTDIDTGAFQLACGAALSALGIHSAATGSGDANKQGGFARIGLLIAIASVAMLAACTTTTASLYRGYATDAKAGIQTWDDNAIATLKDVFCAQPYSAIQRHPEIQPGVSALCGQLASGSSIDPAQAQRLLDIAKQLGVTAAPAK
jgi:hypothetical protein